jgi:predicted transcriptional regulator YheO
MVQIALAVCSVLLVILGIKGFTEKGVAVTRSVALKGTTGKIVGTLCILLGLSLIPIFLITIKAVFY